MPGRLVVFLLLVCSALPVQAQESSSELEPRVGYEVDVSDPAAGTVPIEMSISGVERDPLIVGIPTWRPGSYRMQPYADWYQTLTAVGPSGKELAVHRKDTLTYEIATGGAKKLTIRYALKPPSADLSADHFWIDAVGTYPYLLHYKHAASRVKFKLPKDWDVATGLEKKGDWYEARDYDTFADCPTELGKFTLHEFKEGGALHQIAVHGPQEYDKDKFIEMHRKIVAEQCRIFGGPPYSRYVFLYHFNNRFGGYGLEHLNSTGIAFNAPSLKAGVNNLAPLTSHEFFHTWNVKRIRPKVLGPFDYSRDVRTRALWWSEGVTDYYGHLTLVRAGITSEAQFLAHLAREIATLQSEPDRKRTSVETASWNVWDGYRKVDYYNKGLLLGALIDLRMRRLTHGRKNLDDVMRFLYEWFVTGGGGPIGVGFEEGDLLRAVNAVSGRDFAGFFKKYVSGTEELPYDEELAGAGLKLVMDVKPRPFLGLTVRDGAVRRVTDGGPAQKAGVRQEDRVVAVNGTAVEGDALRDALAALKADEEATLTIEREGAKQDVTMKVENREQIGDCRIEKMDETHALRTSWLTGKEE